MITYNGYNEFLYEIMVNNSEVKCDLLIRKELHEEVPIVV